MATMTSANALPCATPTPDTFRPSVVNQIMGTILSVESTPCWVVHVRTDEGGSLDLQIDGSISTPELQPYLLAGHRLLIAIDAAQVKLTPQRPRNLLEHNLWPGRVVLVQHAPTVITVKILGQQITLKSAHAEAWFPRPLRVWDSTSVSIAPEAVRIVPLGTCARLRRRLLVERAV